MAFDQDLKDPTPTGEHLDQQQEDPTKVFLAVGDRAFKDADSVAKHIQHAQNHIATLENERKQDKELMAQLTAEVERLKKIEEAIRQGNPGTGEQTALPSKDELAKQAAQLAIGILESTQTENQQKANLAKAEEAAKQKFGEAYKQKVAEKAKQVGLTLKAVDALAAESPDAFAKLFLDGQPVSSSQPTSGTVDTASLHEQKKPVERKNIVKMSDKERREYVASLLRQPS